MDMKKRLVIIGALSMVLGVANAEIKIQGDNKQAMKVEGAVVNMAAGSGAVAVQNLSSNKGEVSIGGDKTQSANVTGTVLIMAAGNNVKAKQNLASKTDKLLL